MDELRLLLMREPRGHGAMSGAILQPPTRPDADWGVLFIEVSGLLPMCGHGTIGVATVLVETGMVEVTEPETVIRLDVPAGLVEARVRVENGRAQSVTIRNVPSFLHARDRVVDVPGYGGITYDMAFGGQLLRDHARGRRGPGGRSGAQRRADRGGPGGHGRDQRGRPPGAPGRRAHQRLPSRRLPRAGPRRRRRAWPPPRSTRAGWTARRAERAPARGWRSCRRGASWRSGEPFVNQSVIGTRFTGRAGRGDDRGGRAGGHPEITGRAWITGMGQYLLDAEDPFPAGFSLS